MPLLFFHPHPHFFHLILLFFCVRCFTRKTLETLFFFAVMFCLLKQLFTYLRFIERKQFIFDYFYVYMKHKTYHLEDLLDISLKDSFKSVFLRNTLVHVLKLKINCEHSLDQRIKPSNFLSHLLLQINTSTSISGVI